MKKIALTLTVVFGFIAYSIANRVGLTFGKSDDDARVVPPTDSTTTNGSTLTVPSTPSTTTTNPQNSNNSQTQQHMQSMPGSMMGGKSGTFTGDTIDVYYGFVQVQATLANGELTDVQFLQYPSDRSTSVRINQQAMPYLIQEAIKAQSANVNVISGATFTSQGFIKSLQSALNKAS